MRVLIALLAAGAAAGILLVLMEVVARWWLRFENAYYVWAPGAKRVLWPDRDALPFAEPCMHFDVNSMGERGAELSDTEGVYRVLAVGGSAVECILLDQSSSWPGAMETILNRPENRKALGVSRVHVGNLGKSGLDSRALAVALQRVLRRYRDLDAIVVMVGGSNVMRWLTAGAPGDAAAPPVPDAEIFDWQPNGPFRLFPPRSTALAEIARRIRLRVLRPIENRQNAGRFLTKMRAMRARATFRDSVSDATAMADDYEAGLRDSVRIAMQHSRRVIVARQPWFDKAHYSPEEDACLWHGGLSDAFVEEVKTFATSKVICDAMAELDRRAAKVANELGVEQIDLRNEVEPSLAHYYDILHFTPAGSRRVAEEVAVALTHNASCRTARSREVRQVVRPLAAARAGAGDRIRRVAARDAAQD